MSNGETGDWYDEEKKNAAVRDFLRYLATHQEAAKRCVGNDEEAHRLFTSVTGIEVPAGERVIVFESIDRRYKGPVILAIPPASKANAEESELDQYILGDYNYWRPPSSSATN